MRPAFAIAYEPVWAIGTGQDRHARDGAGGHRLRAAARWRQSLGEEAAEAVRILYGGSVGPHNIDELMAQPDIDGVLVGGASLQVESFARIVDFEKP